MFFVDSGRFEYQGSSLSHTLHLNYSVATHAHNTLRIDGRQQQAAPEVFTSPLPRSDWDFGADRDVVRGSMRRVPDAGNAPDHAPHSTHSTVQHCVWSVRDSEILLQTARGTEPSVAHIQRWSEFRQTRRIDGRSSL